MRRSTQAVLAGALGLTTAAGQARADHTSAHITLVSNVAATDNVFAAPDGGDRQADIFVQVRPGVLLAYEQPRLIQELTAEVEALDYVRNYSEESINYHAGYRAKLDPSPRTSVLFFANGTTGELSQLEARNSPDQTGVALTPPGKVDVRQGDATETYRYQLSQDASFLQGATARFADTNDNVSQDITSIEAGATLGLERTWRGDALTLEIGGEVLHLQRLGPVGGPAGVDRLDRQLNPHATLNWRHDFDKHWSSSLSGGLIVVNPYGIDPYNPLDVSRTRQYYPVVTGLVAYNDDWGRATLTAGRAVTPNLFVAQNTASDFVVAQAAIPLWFTHRHRSLPQYVGAASIGYSQTELLDSETSEQVGTFAIYHADVGVSYAPRPGLAYSLRYEYFRQSADPGASALFGSYSRQTVFATLAVRWPEQITVDVPRRSQSTRADGQDLKPIGDEQVVPDDDSTSTSDKRGQGGGGNQGGVGTSGVSGSGTSGTSGTGASGGVSGGIAPN